MPVVADQRRIIAQRYRIDDKLGSGGMGTVWRGWDTALQRPVAIKEVVIPAGVPAADAQLLRDRYVREARAAARLRHANVVAVYDMIAAPPDVNETNGGIVWTVMELVAARDLAAIISQSRRLAPRVVAQLGLQLATALSAAHEAGVLHRDVKPANVLVCLPGGDDSDVNIATQVAQARVVLTDFGIASIAGDPSLTRTGQLVGSPSYLAPERLATGSSCDAAADLWALGCTLYAATEGHPPFYGDDPFVVISAITSTPIPQPRHAGALTALLRGLLDKDPVRRWDIDRAIASLQRATEDGPASHGFTPAAVNHSGVSEASPTQRAPEQGESSFRPRHSATGRSVRTQRSRQIRLRVGATIVAIVLLAGAAVWQLMG